MAHKMQQDFRSRNSAKPQNLTNEELKMHRLSRPATGAPARRSNSRRFRLLLIIMSASALWLHSGAFHKQQLQPLQDNGVHASILDSHNGVSSFDCAKLDDFIVNRYEWEAEISTKRLERFPRKPRRVFVHHHTAHSPEEEPLAKECQLDGSNCPAFLRRIQHEHQTENEWPDICYNFVLAPDGTIYEGLGGSFQGFHTANYNNESLGVALLGDYSRRTPSGQMLGAFNELLECLVELGQLDDEYALHGHRDARCTSCPGQAAYRQLQTMQHFEAGPLARYSCPSSSSSSSSSVSGRSNSQPWRRGRRFFAPEGRSPQLDKLTISKGTSSDKAVILVNVPAAAPTQPQVLQPSFYLLTSGKTLSPSTILITSNDPSSSFSSGKSTGSSSSPSSTPSGGSPTGSGPSGANNKHSAGSSNGSSAGSSGGTVGGGSSSSDGSPSGGSGGSDGKSKSNQDKNQDQSQSQNQDQNRNQSQEFDGEANFF